MQLIPRIHRGQVKPWTSIPRIDWSHPLTQGLVFYGYDTGLGNVIDLTSGRLGTKRNTPANKPSKFGAGTNYPGTGIDGAIDFPPNPALPTTFLAPYSTASAYCLTSAPGAGGGGFGCAVFQLCDSIGNSYLGNWVGTDFSSTVSPNNSWVNVGIDSGTSLTSGVATVLNIFNTTLTVATGANSEQNYVNGAADTSDTKSTSVTIQAPPAAFTFNEYLPNGISQGNGVAGFIYYGAVWLSRALTAAEARQLHDDPWCFLIFPEDEMLAMLGGTTALVPYNPQPQWAPIFAH